MGKKILVAEKPPMETIIYQIIEKRTNKKTYFEYLVKWKVHPKEYASWVSE
jgi:hypothetical protein